MANFGYTPSTTGIETSSPTINVESKTAKNINAIMGLVETGGNLATTIKRQEMAQTAEDKKQSDLITSNKYITSSTQSKLQFQIDNQNKTTEEKQELLLQFNNTTRDNISKLPIELQNTEISKNSRFVGYEQAKVNRAHTQDNKLYMTNLVSSVAADVLSLDPKSTEYKETVGRMYEEGELRGTEKSYLSEKFLSSYVETKISSLDKETLTYKQALAVQDDINSVITSDKNYKGKHVTTTAINSANRMVATAKALEFSNLKNEGLVWTGSTKSYKEKLKTSNIFSKEEIEIEGNKLDRTKALEVVANAKKDLSFIEAYPEVPSDPTETWNKITTAYPNDPNKQNTVFNKYKIASKVTNNSIALLTTPITAKVLTSFGVDNYNEAIKQAKEQVQSKIQVAVASGNLTSAINIAVTTGVQSKELKTYFNSQMKIDTNGKTPEDIQNYSTGIDIMMSNFNNDINQMRNVMGESGLQKAFYLQAMKLDGELSVEEINNYKKIDKETPIKKEAVFIEKYRGSPGLRDLAKENFRALVLSEKFTSNEAIAWVNKGFKNPGSSSIDLGGYNGAVDDNVKKVLNNYLDISQKVNPIASGLNYNSQDKQFYVGTDGNPYYRKATMVHEKTIIPLNIDILLKEELARPKTPWESTAGKIAAAGSNVMKTAGDTIGYAADQVVNGVWAGLVDDYNKITLVHKPTKEEIKSFTKQVQ